MRSEPTLILEGVRLVAILLGFIGITLSEEDQAALAAGAGVLVVVISAVLAWFNRSRVFSPVTTQKLVNRAAATGDTDISVLPTGDADAQG